MGDGKPPPPAPCAPVFPAAARIPQVGLGTWTQHKQGEVEGAVKAAVRIGFRHIDCAAEYKNEEEVGRALAAVLADGTVRREELWVTSKLMNSDHAPDRVAAACNESLARLGLNYLDLYLMHWPATGSEGPTLEPPLEATWTAMEGLVRRGLVRAIGTSNFSAKKLQGLLSSCSIRPAVNQVEAHPFFRNDDLLAWCKAQDIHMTAYSPLGTPHTAGWFKRETPVLLKDPTVTAIATKHGKSAADVVIAWAVQRGTSCLPKSTNPDHLRSNLAAGSWRLPEDDFKALSSLPTQMRMLDGSWLVSPEGPYRSLEELWDTEKEVTTFGTAAGAGQAGREL